MTRPSFRALDRAECDALLARNQVGRIAFAFHDQVDIEPINFVYAGGTIHGRTGPGTKLGVLAHTPWVAFETDEVETPYRWRSVVVRGTFFLLDPELMPKEHGETLAAIRTVTPAALTADDPAPRRDALFRIDVREVTGRAAD